MFPIEGDSLKGTHFSWAIFITQKLLEALIWGIYFQQRRKQLNSPVHMLSFCCKVNSAAKPAAMVVVQLDCSALPPPVPTVWTCNHKTSSCCILPGYIQWYLACFSYFSILLSSTGNKILKAEIATVSRKTKVETAPSIVLIVSAPWRWAG